ncbi:MAG: DUF4917 family protein [Acidobacteriaceae bacterium]|nr:DUF4917 family protein [Acidobacteriaceae bacterium]MBV9764100.1 DUF4917 family protein [Acidobacteriaceae bacterium]
MVFDDLNTEDFELVLNVIWHAYVVNKALGVPNEATFRAYRDVKKALVGAVRAKHTSFDTSRGYLRPIATFMKCFQTVLSLNYDLIVYWAMMESNTTYFPNWFKDCFVNGVFDRNWRRMRQPYRAAAGSTLVFYPHGNLVLTTSLDGFESKVIRDTASLLDCILKNWQSGDNLPLFVSEGKTDQKERAISRSGYLHTVYNEVMLPDSLGDTCAVYGWSANDNDAHILDRICRATRCIAFSVFRGDRSQAEIEAECDLIKAKVLHINPQIKTQFYWSDSADCWLNTWQFDSQSA